MAYNELIKNFNKIRDYMREFYVYGFKRREEYTNKSARSYDDERRRIESWLGSYMRFRQTSDGKNVFLSIDSRAVRHNPLYKAWKTKSFTDGDITLHFILLDILSSPSVVLSLREITDQLDHYLCGFKQPKVFDESTVRKKLREYMAEGIIKAEKHGKTIFYRRAESVEFNNTDVLDFFSEISPCGVIGSYLLDRKNSGNDLFIFKHHHITGAMDSQVLCALFVAMEAKNFVTIEMIHRRDGSVTKNQVVPLRIMIGAQTGRQYLMAYTPQFEQISSFRLDHILCVKADGVCSRFDVLREKLDRLSPYMWGVSTQGISGQALEHVEFTVRYAENEKYIHYRLEREKRCGIVEKIDDHTSRFSADVLDAGEVIPWIRTFICRIVCLRFSDEQLEKQFWDDLKQMYRLYGLEEGVNT